MLKAVYIMSPEEWPRVYTPPIHQELGLLVNILAPVVTPRQFMSRSDLFEQAEVVFTGWGGPAIDDEFLDKVSRLKGIFHGAGAIRHLLSPTFWDREIVITTANGANAIPVAEYTLAHILLGLKRAWSQAAETKKQRAFLQPPLPVAGAYNRTVGLVSLSTIGRLVRQRLESFDLHVVAYDPTLISEEALSLNVELGTLEEVFANSDVVSLHAPLIPATEGLITGKLLGSMRTGATFINTARGSIVRESEMIEVLRTRPDLTAILDVSDPEPPLATCELFDLPNVMLTPHIAGSLDGECARMGQWIVEELRCYLRGETMRGQLAPLNRVDPAVV
jgi:phosphoglycerate dehydrogenase-like enzyme